MGMFNPSPNREDGKLSGNTEHCRWPLLQGTCIKAPCKWADGHSQLFGVGWQFNMCACAVPVQSHLEGWVCQRGNPSCLKCLEPEQKEPRHQCHPPFPWLVWDMYIPILPIILAPKVIPEILLEHRQTVFCRLSPQVIAFQSVCGSFRPVRSGALNI